MKEMMLMGVVCLGLAVSSSMAADKDSKTTSPEKAKAFKERMEKARLAKFDANNDGVLDSSEKKTMKETYAKTRQERLLKKYDANGNGEIDADEKAQMRADQEERRAKREARKNRENS